jgi:ABC-type multidrug transport system ATPase subunit
MAATITIQGLTKSFGRTRALDGVSFEVPERSVFGLLGPNGAGKTTLFSLVARFLRPDAGRISVLGVDVRRIAELRGRLTILPQDAQFQRNVPIIEQLVFFRLLDGRSRSEAEEEVKRTLQMVGLENQEKRGIHSLSHGMLKRLGIAQAFLGEPEVILLDEPTSGLDPQNARQIRDLILTLRARATVMVSSHNLAEIQEICDHVAILDLGKLVAAGSVADITRSGKELDLELPRDLTEAELAALGSVPGIEKVRPKGSGRYTLSLNLSDDFGMEHVTGDVLRRLLELGTTPRKLSEGSSLEAQFLKLTAKAEGGVGTPPAGDHS